MHAKSASLRVGVRVRVRVISFWGRVCVMIFFKKKLFGEGCVLLIFFLKKYFLNLGLIFLIFGADPDWRPFVFF